MRIFLTLLVVIVLVGCSVLTQDPAVFQKMVEGAVAAQDTLAALD